jgi:diguanylate cyclase (GGDEF)-like protein/PAS domain S-box-containing protein
MTENDYEVLFDMAADCMLVLDMNGIIVQVNQSGAAQRGYTKQEMLGRRISEFDPPEYAVRVPERMEALLRDGHARFESAHICKDGRVMPVEIHSRVIDLAGIPHVLSVIRDITEACASQKIIEQSQLQHDQQNIFLRALLDSAPFGVHMYRLETDGRLIFTGANQSADRILGVANSQFIGQTIEAAFPALVETEVPSQYRRIAHEGGEWSAEQISYSEGQINGAFAVNAFQTLPGQMAVFFRDITSRKQQEQALRESEERLKFALEGSGDGAWDWNPQTDQAVFSTRWKAMIGYAEDEFPDTGAAWVAHLHPEDRERVIFTVQNFFVENTPFYEVEFRMRCKDGSWKWMLARGMLVSRDEQGRPLRMIGTHTDLTERKRTEQMMAEKTSLLAATLESTADGILVVDGKGRISSYNQRFLELWRIPEAVLQSGDDGRAIAHVLEQLADPDAFVQKVHLLYRDTAAESFDELAFVDGRVFERYSRPQRIGEQIVGRVWSFRDVTLRHQAEDSLKIAGMVYANSNEAILVVDADNRIIAINPAFTQTTGYTESDVLGKNPNMLSSGRQDGDFYREMWRELNATGRWQGEMWNRRKNGEIYAEQLSINSIFHPDGSVYRRIALFLDVTEKKKTEEIIWRQANFDALTGLPNRRMLRDRLDHEIKKAQRSSESLALLFIDLDRFKEINDTLGHHVGDELLIEASRRLECCVRESDTIGRLGGDEFTVLVGQLHSTLDVERLANAIIEKLAEPYQLGDELVTSSASIGIAVYPDDATQSAQLLQYADQAMYAAKGQGGGRFSFFTPLLQEEAQHRMRLTGELSGALASGQFRVYFQPIVELASNRIFKAEALLRWVHPQRGMISPMSFIPLAEETGLIIPIGDWVFRESVAWAKRWKDISTEGFQISVNKSPTQFCSGDNADVIWLAFMRESGLTGRNICIEITEGLLLNRDDTTSRKLFSFRDAGVQVSIDDFGTGYSSLSYLKKFDIDYLKIDQSFVRNMVSDPADLALCEAIVVMAHKLGLKVIAEGVETRAQRDLLIQIGCDFAQGYLFARPMPGEELDALLALQQSQR